jgi:hypothetical protein
MLKIYVAHAMTGRSKKEVLAETSSVANLAGQMNRLGCDIRLLDPVVEEGIQRQSKQTISATPTQIKSFWSRDKELIREAHVLLDLTGPLKSEGVAHEIGYARFCLWKPVIRIWPGLGKNSVAWIEDDAVVDGYDTALEFAVQEWGTMLKRFAWRARMLNRSFPKWVGHQIGEWK